MLEVVFSVLLGKSRFFFKECRFQTQDCRMFVHLFTKTLLIMKQFLKALVLVLVLAGGYAQQSQAQVDLTVNPIGLLFGNLGASADFALSETFSIEGQVGVGFGDGNLFGSGYKYFSLPITATGKYYFSPNRGADRFYASAFLRYVNRSYRAEDGSDFAEYTQTRFGGGFGLGYKVVAEKGFVFDIGLGLGRTIVNNHTLKSNDEDFLVEWPGIMIIGKLALGYRFGGQRN
jgi:hypothetical protein